MNDETGTFAPYTMNKNNDPMGRAISDYYRTGTAGRLRVFSPMFEEDEIPLETLFRTYDTMPAIERRAIDMAQGRTLDVGAASGCHSLALQERGIGVTAIDISPLAVETMRLRGVRDARLQDFFMMEGERYDTILMLMNGIGIAGTLERLSEWFGRLDKVLAKGGQVLCDSSDISYVFDGEMPDMEYYGEQSFWMEYEDTVGEPFPWLYIDADTLRQVAAENGYRAEVVAEGEHYDYLARITRK